MRSRALPAALALVALGALPLAARGVRGAELPHRAAWAPVTVPASAPAPTPVPGREPPFVLVVNAANPATALPREYVGRLFLKKIRRWPDGTPVLVADLPPEADVRGAFSQRVLARSVGTVRAYWQQRIFSGRDVPPPEKASEAEVLDFVRAHPGAIGYVSPGAALPRGVRALELAE